VIKAFQTDCMAASKAHWLWNHVDRQSGARTYAMNCEIEKKTPAESRCRRPVVVCFVTYCHIRDVLSRTVEPMRGQTEKLSFS